MSAVNVIMSSLVHVMADAAYCHVLTGKLAAIAPKILVLPECSAVLALRGPMGVFRALRTGIESEGFASFAELLDYFVGGSRVLRRYERLLRAVAFIRRADPAALAFEFVLAGWQAASGGPAAYLVTFRNGYAVEPMQIGINVAPPPSDEALSAVGWAWGDPAKFEPRADGILLMEAQRKTWNWKRGASVGGFVQCATVSASGIFSSVIHRWPDEIGKPVSSEPASVRPKPSPTVIVAAAGLRGVA